MVVNKGAQVAEKGEAAEEKDRHCYRVPRYHSCDRDLLFEMTGRIMEQCFPHVSFR